MPNLKVVNNGANSVFVELNGDKYCFSYGEMVASIVDGLYTEFMGDKYFSRTSCRHKSSFRNYYSVM